MKEDRMRLRFIALAALFGLALLGTARPAQAADRTFDAGSLIIPMDLSYQATGMFQAYGLLNQLLKNGIRVYWMIDPNKTYHPVPCNTAGNTCAWDCRGDAPGIKCPYPTASPDFTATTTVVSSDTAVAPGTPVGTHAYRGGPFVIDAADRARALPIIAAWNDVAMTPRPVFRVVTVHEATAAFTGNVAKEMVAAPTIAVFADKNEDVATAYLRAAGIPQSNGQPFPAGKCNANGSDCGPGTVNPDLLHKSKIAGELGTCDNPNYDHKNGALWTADGLPAYCQIMSMHWDVSDRETVTCSPNCGTVCTGQAYTYHGHEVVAEVREFLKYPVHFFAECQAVNAYENLVPNPAYPYLDDPGREGHFLTTTGDPPLCPTGTCTGGAKFECVQGGCNGQACCLPKDIKEQGAGFLIAAQPSSNSLKVLRPEIPYNQFDGRFGTVGGSEPAYNLSTYLNTTYKNNRQVTLITGANGPGDQDVWMSGYLDGECDIVIFKDGGTQRSNHSCTSGKISYLGGHQFNTGTPVTSGGSMQGTRLFLNALFEADCVTSDGQPSFELTLSPKFIAVPGFPVEADVTVGFANQAIGFALDASFAELLPAGATAVTASGDGAIAAAGVTWAIGSISGAPAKVGDPPSSASYVTRLAFAAEGTYPITLELEYRVGTSTLTATRTFDLFVGVDSDGDGVPDVLDPFPDDPTRCGDHDGDGCDDCAPSCDDDGDGPGLDGGAPGGCCETGSNPAGPIALGLGLFVLIARPRRRR
jgi:hypothetical protein